VKVRCGRNMKVGGFQVPARLLPGGFPGSVIVCVHFVVQIPLLRMGRSLVPRPIP